MKSYSYDEIVALQGEPDPNAEYADTSETFWLLIPDAPQDMKLRSAFGEGYTTGTVDYVSVTYAEGLDTLKQYDGQQMILSIDPDLTWWSSDTTLPLGKPLTLGEVHVLE